MKIEFNNEKGFRWAKDNNIYVKGQVYYDGKLLNSIQILEELKKFKRIEEIELILKKFEGVFLIAIELKDYLIVAVDKLRTIPCYYKVEDNNIMIFDTINKKKIEIDQINLEEFQLTGYVTGTGTILKKIYQIKASNYLKINKKDMTYINISYSENYSEIFNDFTYSENFENIKKIFLDVGKKLTMSLNEKTAVVPLSGGYDSRIILDLLYRNNYKDIICYTYGRKNSQEVKVSKEIAKRLGCKWIFIEYTKEAVDEAWSEYEKFKKEIFDYTSSLHIQDFVALYHMYKNHLIPKHSVIIPGHSGDLLGGSHLLKLQNKLSKKATIKDIYSHLYETHYQYKNKNIKYKEYHIKKIKEELKNAELKINKLMNLSDYWNINNRQSKFIVNSVRSYEYFGYEWRIPLWNEILAKYFYSLNLEFKIEKIIYNDILEEFFKEDNIDINLKRETLSSKLKKKIREILSERSKDFIKKRLKKKIDFNNFDYIGEKLTQDNKGFKNHINSKVIMNLMKDINRDEKK